MGVQKSIIPVVCALAWIALALGGASPVVAQVNETDTERDTESESERESESAARDTVAGEAELGSEIDAAPDAAVDAADSPAPDAEAGAALQSDAEPTAEPTADADLAESDAVAESDAAAEPDEEEDEGGHVGRFSFGSYGRVVAATDLRGSLARDADFVAYGPRIDEDVYTELELARTDEWGQVTSSIVTTLALVGPLFHLDAEFEESLAVRNLYAQAAGMVKGLSVWAGSRMVRGDDIYLLNWWPLDNLNLIGGGLDYDWQERLQIRFAGGLSRPKSPFQLQEARIVAQYGFEPETVNLLDRPRFIAGLRATYFPRGYRGDWGWKVVLYGEAHVLPGGEREDSAGALEQLPSDAGFLVGAQVGLWNSERSFAHIFLRYAHGLAAYNPMSAPFRTSETIIRTGRTKEFLVAFSGNWESHWVGLQAGAYYRLFRDVDASVLQGGYLTEGAINLRPHVYLHDWFGVAADLAYERLELAALDGRGNPIGGSAFKLGLIPYVSLAGRGTFTRPVIRLIYTATIRDDGAMAMIAEDDPRYGDRIEHYLGVGAEWWFNSTSYQ